MAPFEGLERWVKKLQLALDMAEVAEFLGLHDLNIYHRNGQPHIKLITPDGKVLIGPEGLSKNSNLFSTPSELAYTFYYRSSYGFRLRRALDVIPILQSSPQNPFTSRYALEVLDLWSRYFEPNALSWESHWAWLCPEGLKCGDIGYFFLDDRDPHRQEVIFQALGTTNRSEWRFDPEVQEERRRSFQRERYESLASSSTSQDMCIFLSNIPSISSRYGVEMDKLILSATSLLSLKPIAILQPLQLIHPMVNYLPSVEDYEFRLKKEGQPTPWGYWSFDPRPLMTPENSSYSPENIQNHPGIIAQASLEGVHVQDSIELVSLRFLQLTPDEVELVKLLHHHMQTEEHGVDETLPQYLTLPRNAGPDWGPRARITEIEEA
ncbi:hypothetical protein HETIRDRAFT_429941 [Heterobasidion irregulare TC 32-1]|uniref:Uncharacterized protein n=1 Tax=Heterobasidion irregulare (strain TC 32-1) TaxID=747525 RepID=W4JST5_HETIT|nr:uncharacterized protein HETIRDRAFT_429941 [Heterobasidion irregulare TC 32-1]ETW76519.1 hypothetical protein HETIRDRAFT_429941 [Heterobasidion irregulare TC 32-1]